MFTSGQSMYAGFVFSFLSYAVAVPSAIKVYNWTATLYQGQIELKAPLLYALGFIALFVVGGTRSTSTSTTPTSWSRISTTSWSAARSPPTSARCTSGGPR